MQKKEVELTKAKRAQEKEQRRQERLTRATEREALKEFNKKWTNTTCAAAGKRLWTTIRQAMANPSTTTEAVRHRPPSQACNWNRGIAVAKRRAKKRKIQPTDLPQMLPIPQAFAFTAAHLGSIASREALEVAQVQILQSPSVRPLGVAHVAPQPSSTPSAVLVDLPNEVPSTPAPSRCT